MNAHLLPCPFPSCDEPGRLLMQKVRADDGERFMVGCNSCGANGPWEKTEQEAAEAWNEAPRQPEIAA